jgi:hypothetical protein
MRLARHADTPIRRSLSPAGPLLVGDVKFYYLRKLRVKDAQ